MRPSLALPFLGVLVTIPHVADGLRILLTNNDGWATFGTRSLFHALNETYDVVLSAPPDNKSGHSVKVGKPVWRHKACQFESCRADSPPYGRDPDNPDFNYVNAYPKGAAQWGLEVFGPMLWKGEQAELLITGVNAGPTVSFSHEFSSTSAVAAWAVARYHIPAIAMSGWNRDVIGHNDPDPPLAQKIYAELGKKIVDYLVEQGPPFMPRHTFMNVNFPRTRDECVEAKDFRFVLTRVYPAHYKTDPDWCAYDYLPDEHETLDGHLGRHMPCTVTISLVNVFDQTTEEDDQRMMQFMDKIKFLVDCPHPMWWEIWPWPEGMGWKKLVGRRRPASDPANHQLDNTEIREADKKKQAEEIKEWNKEQKEEQEVLEGDIRYHGLGKEDAP